MRRLLFLLEKYPVRSFFALLILLFGVIALASSLRTPEPVTETAAKDPKLSRAFPASETGFVMVTGQVKKSDVIDVVAATGGMVRSVSVRVGQTVAPGTPLVHLTTDFGAESGRLTAAKGRLQANFTERIGSLQKEILEREKKITRSDDTLTDREKKNALRNLKIELERLKVNQEVAKLDAALAERSDAVFTPKSIFSGTVEYLGVRPGETVAPGTVIATIRGNSDHASLVASVPDHIAHTVDPRGIGTLILDSGEFSLSGGYLARGENSLGLRSITFPLAPELSHALTNSEFVNIFLPLIHPDDAFFVPIDAILSGPAGQSVLVLEGANGVAERTIETGAVTGSFVLVTKGLTTQDTILLNRDLAPGDTVTLTQ